MNLYLRENAGEILICIGVFFCIVGVLNVTMLESPWFILFSYIGSISLTCGILIILELLPAKIMSLRGLLSIFLLISALLFTTCVVVLFLDVEMTIKIYQIFPITSPRGDVFDVPGPELYPIGGPQTKLIRPFAWLFSPLLTMGIILTLASFAIMYIGGVY